MTGQRILRVSRVDSSESAICLLSLSSDGSNPLDLKLVGTDLESAFVATSKFDLPPPCPPKALIPSPPIHLPHSFSSSAPCGKNQNIQEPLMTTWPKKKSSTVSLIV